MRSLEEIHRLPAEADGELAKLAARRSELRALVSELQKEKASFLVEQEALLQSDLQPVTNQSPQEAKIALFRSLFRGRDDVYARRFESLKSGKQGYQPACRNEWASGVCNKPKGRYDDCAHRDLLPVTDDVVRNHLLGVDPRERPGRDFTIGLYPMLLDETCWFLAVDLDKASWQEDAGAFLETCRYFDVTAALERSRSGNGGHYWIFLSEPVPAALVRRMGAFLLTQTMERRPEIGLDYSENNPLTRRQAPARCTPCPL